jgi:hypothetical protein
MAPYRSREPPEAAREAPRTGLVADMVRQFADVHAFVRELIQNGIDAGATAIEVTVERSSDGIASVRVADDGCGMTLDVMENALLVLFRSTKDNDASKIGKYGVGFMSVFAIEPSEVTVDSWRDGQSYRVRLFPDHSYEIEHATPRQGHGSTVMLSKSLAAEDFPGFGQKVTASLQRWCRHAEVPIHLAITDASRDEPVTRRQVNAPLEVRAVVSVRQKWDDMEIVVGPIAGSGVLPDAGNGEDAAGPFAGFYNRGLTLYETTEPLAPELSQVRVKVQSRLLRHTLSRDDVRRDRAFLLALARAKELCATSLRDRAMTELAAAAEAVANGEPDTRFVGLLSAATLRPISLRSSDLRLPLVHPVGGVTTMSPEQLRAAIAEQLGATGSVVYASLGRSDLTRALAACGVPVVWAVSPILPEAIDRATRGRIRVAPVADEVLLVRELAGSERLSGDDALCAGLGEALAETGVDRVAIGAMPGDDDRIGAIVPGPVAPAAAYVVARSAAAVASAVSGTKWPKGSLLVLRADSEPVANARRATSPAIGAHLLARYLLLLGPGLPSRTSEALAIRALEKIQ